MVNKISVRRGTQKIDINEPQMIQTNRVHSGKNVEIWKYEQWRFWKTMPIWIQSIIAKCSKKQKRKYK